MATRGEAAGAARGPRRISAGLKKILAIPPTNSWLLMGDEESFPTEAELQDMWRRPFSDDHIWTVSRQTQPGDLLFFYFMAPHKAIHFVARAASYPFFDSNIGVNAVGEVDPNQWWVNFTSIIEVAPVSFKMISDLMNGNLNLRGKPNHYLPPAVVRGILGRAVDPDRMSEVERLVCQEPVGSAELPDPERVDLAGWSRMADGPLTIERLVEQHVVEPLLRLSLPKRSSLEWKKGQRLAVGRGIPDYTIFESAKARSVIEVKLGVRVPRDDDWSRSPDMRQVLGYSRALDVAAMLVDCNKIFLIPRGASAPTVTIERDRATAEDLRVIGSHLVG